MGDRLMGSTWTLGSLAVSPRLSVNSAEKGPVNEALEALHCTCARPEFALLPSAAAIFRLTEAHRPTWLLDEFENTLAANEEAKAALLAIINGG